MSSLRFHSAILFQAIIHSFLKDKYSIEFLSRVKQWAFTQAVSPYWRGPSRKSKKKKRKLEKNESARARNSGSEAHEKWALRRAIPFYFVLN